MPAANASTSLQNVLSTFFDVLVFCSSGLVYLLEIDLVRYFWTTTVPHRKGHFSICHPWTLLSKWFQEAGTIRSLHVTPFLTAALTQVRNSVWATCLVQIHSFIRIYFIRISRLKIAKFWENFKTKPEAVIKKKLCWKLENLKAQYNEMFLTTPYKIFPFKTPNGQVSSDSTSWPRWLQQKAIEHVHNVTHARQI